MIVVLQSSLTNQRIFHNVLAKSGHEEITLTDRAIEAQTPCCREDPALLIGDKSLVRTEDGYIWTKWSRPAEAGPLAVIVTGYQFGKREAMAFIRAGADELLILPFEPEQLLSKVRSLSQGLQAHSE